MPLSRKGEIQESHLRDVVLGVVMQSSTKTALKSANSMLGVIMKGIQSTIANIVRSRYKSIMVTHLEGYICFWSQQLKKTKLKRGQKRRSRMIKSLRCLLYAEKAIAIGTF